jgi:dTDP-4-amino-4,6-dideoxygalactose transaminase
MVKEDKIRLSKSVVGNQEIEAISRVILKDGYLGMGKEVQNFERGLQRFLRTERQVVCVNSGTAALHLAVMAVVKPEEEVLVQSLTYLASFQAISAAGAVPVPCEVKPKTITIDLQDAQKRLSERTRAIMPVHYASRAEGLDEVYEFAKKYNLRVIEDAAHAFGGVYQGKNIGSFGDIVCFSFDGVKNITCGEGGAVISDDEKVIEFVKDARLLGIQKDTQKRYQGERSWEFDVTHQGYRYHMSNIFATIGIVQLGRFEREFKIKRQMLARRYHEALKMIEGITLLPNDYNRIVPHIFPIRVLNNRRNDLRQRLLDKNIECGIHYYPNHLLTYYGARKGQLPVTERIYNELLTLPLHPDLTEEDQDRVVKQVKEFFFS